jgi:hypothetical protein
MRLFKYIVVGTLLLLAPLAVIGLESVGRDYHFKIMDTSEAVAPQIVENTVFFTFKPNHQIRFAGIAFEHENYRVRPMESNPRGVMVYVLPIPDGMNQLDYRLVVDGLWQPDPANPRRIRDPAGVLLSRFDLPRDVVKPVKSPDVDEAERLVTFTWKGAPGELVFLAGSFNNWDPFSHRLIEKKDRSAGSSLYSLSLQLLPGSYYYYYLVDGRREIDPANSRHAVDTDRNSYSAFNLP